MRLSLFSSWAVIVTMIAGGCASPSLSDPHDTPHSSELSLPQETSVAASTMSLEDSPRPIPKPGGSLTLQEALQFAMAHNPRLRASQWETRQARALEGQAGVWPNPSLGTEVENVGGSGDFSGTQAAETTLSLAQVVPLGSDIESRRAVAEQHTQLAYWDYKVEHLEVMVEVTERFLQAMVADRHLSLATQELELARRTGEVAAKRVEAGDASPVERTRSIVPVIEAELARNRAERLRDAAYHRLALTWGSRNSQFENVVGDLEKLAPIPEPHRLVAHVNDNPHVARWTAAIGKRIAERRLAEAEAVPDLTARLGAKHDNGSDSVGLIFGLSLPLPVFDRREHEIRAARANEQAAHERQHATKLEIESLLSAAYADLLSARDEAVALRQRALPAAQQAHDATQQAFAEGKLALLDVLDAQQTLFDLQRRYLDALFAYHMATAEIESLIGQRLDDLVDASPVINNENP